jgi:hypothetical protein
MRISTASQQLQFEVGRTMLFYGVTGVGKTVFGAQAPGCVDFDMEGGSVSIQPGRKDIPVSFPDIPIINIESWSDIMEVQAAFTSMKPGEKLIKLRGQEIPIETALLDTIGELGRIIMFDVLRGANREVPRFDEWNLAIERVRRTCRFFRDLRLKGLNVIFIAHEDYEKQDLTSTIMGLPDVLGRQLPQEVAGYMDIVCHMTFRTDPKTGVQERVLCTQRDGIFVGRDRTWALDKYEPADFPKFWAKVLKSKEQSNNEQGAK